MGVERVPFDCRKGEFWKKDLEALVKKKGIVLVLCLVIVGALAVNPTLASKVQDIFQDVSHRIGDLFGQPVEDTQGLLDTRLCYFKADQETGRLTEIGDNDPSQLMIPAHYPADYNWETVNVRLDGKTYPLFDKSRVSGVVDKFASVKNVGEETAYFRVAFAVEKTDVVQQKMHFLFSGDTAAFEIAPWREIRINGRDYQMIVYSYRHPLEAGQVSPPMLLQAVMQSEVTSKDLAQLKSDFLQVKVMSIQADVFKEEQVVNGEKVMVQLSAKEALDMAVPVGDGFNPFR